VVQSVVSGSEYQDFAAFIEQATHPAGITLKVIMPMFPAGSNPDES